MKTQRQLEQEFKKKSVHYVGCVADRFPDIPAKPPDLMS